MSKVDVDLENIAVVEPVGTIIMKSVTRSITLSEMSTGTKKHDGELKTLILNEVKRLPNSFQKKYENLFLSQNPLSNHKDIQEITEKIIEAITQKVKIQIKGKISL